MDTCGMGSRRKTFSVDLYNSTDESLCIAMKYGLEKNATLEHLKFRFVPIHDEIAALWCRALSFLRTNKALKSLQVRVLEGFTESCLSAFRIYIASMLQENKSLESLSIFSSCSRTVIKAEDCFALVTALQHKHTTLKYLSIEIEFHDACSGSSLSHSAGYPSEMDYCPKAENDGAGP
jgi:hypothetical protein